MGIPMGMGMGWVLEHHRHHHVRLMEVVKRNRTEQLTNLLKVRKTYFKYGICSVNGERW